MAYLDILWSLYDTPKSNTLPSSNTLPPRVNQSLDWNKSVIAGSYALQQFIGDTKWEPEDVDIMVACQNKEEFEQESAKFAESSHAELVKEAWFGEEPKATFFDKSELFHHLVLGSRTYQLNDFTKPVQLICLKSTPEASTPQAILSETCDIPSCVSYTMHKEKKIFHIPEKGREILLTGKGPKADVCPSRLEKYMKRGFDFY